jgi:hypothetical protein
MEKRMHGQPRRLRPETPRHVRQLLAELELIAHGSCQAWNSAGGHGESTTVLPFGELHPPHITLRILYIEQHTDAGRSSVVKAMEDELEAVRGHVDRSHVVGESREDEDKRIVKQGEGFNADEVALRFNCTPTRVRRARLAAGRSPRDGTAPRASVEVEDGQTEALRMKAQGMSVRAIAMVLVLPKSTIHDWVKAA